MIGNPLFDGLTDEQRAEIARLATLEHHHDGDIIVHEGDAAPVLFLLEEGRIKVVKSDSSSTGRFPLTSLSQGEAFGEMRLIDSRPASASVVADGEVAVWRVEIGPVLSDPRHAELRARLHANLAGLLARRLRHSSQLAADKMLVALQQSRARESAGRFVIALVATACACILGIAALVELGPARRPSQTWVSAISILASGLLMYRLLRGGSYSWETYGITRDRLGRTLRDAFLYTLPALALLTGFKWALIHFTPALSNEPLFRPDAMFHGAPFRPGMYVAALAVYIVLSPVQEFFARAGLQGSLRILMPRSDGKTNWKVILIANLVFASMHGYIGFKFAIAAFVPGLLWGWLYDRQRSLAGAAFSHVLLGVHALFVLGLQALVISR